MSQVNQDNVLETLPLNFLGISSCIKRDNHTRDGPLATTFMYPETPVAYSQPDWLVIDRYFPLID